MDAQKPLIVFDVNETLLDLESVTPVGPQADFAAADPNAFVDQLRACYSSYGHK